MNPFLPASIVMKMSQSTTSFRRNSKEIPIEQSKTGVRIENNN